MIGDDPTSFSKQGLSQDINKLDIDPKLMGMIQQALGFQVYSHTVNSTELLSRTNFILYLMSQS